MIEFRVAGGVHEGRPQPVHLPDDRLADSQNLAAGQKYKQGAFIVKFAISFIKHVYIYIYIIQLLTLVIYI